MANTAKIIFNGFNELAEAIDRCQNDVHMAVDEALKETGSIITPQLDKAMSNHNKTFKTVQSLITDENVKWHGSVATMDIGFRIRNGGLASIFLMYGTPRMKKDQALYNAIKGSKTKKEIAEVQKKVMSKYLSINKQR